MARDPETIAHQEWLGYVQPVGLVVSIPALLAAQAQINRNITSDHARFLACLHRDSDGQPLGELRDFGEFTNSVLGWRESDLESVRPGDPVFAALEVALPEYHETLRPTYVVRELDPKDAERPWMMLVQVLPPDRDLDSVATSDDRHWQATPQAKFERLLRETQVPLGLLCNNKHIRMVYAPRGETSGYMSFSVAEMMQVAGRPIFAALHMLLCDERLFSLGEKQRLPAILADSRKYQNTVSTQLAEQVLAALNELLRGFQAANDQQHGQLLREILAANPNHVYSGLLTVLLRLVFILYAEDRNLLSSDPVYSNYYSVTGLFDRLRADAGRYPDTMDQRYGGWAQLLTLFRLIYEGGRHAEFRIPARQGYLFDPDRYEFLEGRSSGSVAQEPDSPATNIPRVSDGVVFRVLNNLLILDGERLSYRTLDVEQIGSVYEAMMGFELEVAAGRSIAIKPKKSHGAPATINLEELLSVAGKDRTKWLKDQTEQSLTGAAAESLKSAGTIEELLAALDRKIARNATPNVVAKGAMVFQPSDERRRSGSHYTPRSLTEPIVRTTLKPILEQFGAHPKPEQLLDLKICDLAVGSGAFQVESCRQLGDELVKAWHIHNCVPSLPPDEDEVLHARRLVAQRCLYGVDRNPMAIDLAKLSLWLVTLAKDHPFTFLDHSFRCGDSLVGLTRAQIAGFHWAPSKQRDIEGAIIDKRIQRAADYRKQILQARDDVGYLDQSSKLALAEDSLALVRLTGDLVVSAFFSADKDKSRRARCDELFGRVSAWFAGGMRTELREPLGKAVAELRAGPHPIRPFHWEIEFPEVFARENRGFDCIVGNPPFAGKNTLINGNREGYLDWLKEIHEESHGNADLVAHFFRRAFNSLRLRGCFGLIATNTIGQGDTRSTGLRWICVNGGTIFSARKRYKWPGQAAVIVSVVHVSRGEKPGPFLLDGRYVPIITAYLFHAGGNSDPRRLDANDGKSFIGSYVLGLGFTFDDSDASGEANPLLLFEELVRKDPRNRERIFPYINGGETNESPTLVPHRKVISFGEMDLKEAEAWPDLLKIAETKVKPARAHLTNNAIGRQRSRHWWRFASSASRLYDAIRGLRRVCVRSLTSTHFPTFTFLPTGYVYDQTLVVFAVEKYYLLSILCSRAHEAWAVFFGATMKDDPRYNVDGCYKPFAFPEQCETDGRLERAGGEYYEFRAALMIRNNEGLTKTYNRFHDPDERSADILELRELHAAMDWAVLEAYGWHDLAQSATCEFLLDYEDEDEDDEPSGRRPKKKPWRYRWPDDFRDEVLARLLALNQQRAEEEHLAGLAAESAENTSGNATTAKGRKKSLKVSPGQKTLDKMDT